MQWSFISPLSIFSTTFSPFLHYPCLGSVNNLLQLVVVSHKDSTTQKTQKKVMGKIHVSGKRLNLGVRGPGEKPSWGETRSIGTEGSHPGKESWSVSGGEPHIPQSLGTEGNQEGWPSAGWSTDQVGPGVHTLERIFYRPVSKGLLWGKVQPGVALPCHGLWSMWRQEAQSPTVQGE